MTPLPALGKVPWCVAGFGGAVNPKPIAANPVPGGSDDLLFLPPAARKGNEMSRNGKAVPENRDERNVELPDGRIPGGADDPRDGHSAAGRDDLEDIRIAVGGGARVAGDRPPVAPRGVLPPVRKLPSLRPRDHGPSDDPWEGSYPYLCAYLYRGSWNDIDPREGSKLEIKAAGGAVYLSLKCPTEGVQLTKVGQSLKEAFGLLEAACGDPATHWTEMKWGTGAQKARDLRKKEVDKRRSITDDTQ